MNRDLFEDLFVLELANNHLGRLERGIRIVTEFSRIVRFNGVRAAIKLQFRDVDTFIHKDYRGRSDLRYIKKTLETQLTKQEIVTLVDEIRKGACIPMATPFDESSVDLCGELGLPIIKLASSDVNDWPLVERIAALRRPVIISTGGTSLKDLDDLVSFFEKRNIPLAVNHCVAIYPSEDSDLELNQIEFLAGRYPGHVIGLSTHEYHDWQSSIMIAYAKGARTFERHVDVEEEGLAVSPYCSLPHQADAWIKAWKKAREMCGASCATRRVLPEKEIRYLDALVRGVYARRDLPEGYIITHERVADDVYLAIPLLQGQISCRELMSGERLLRTIRAHEPIRIDDIESPYAYNPQLKEIIYNRGLKDGS